MLPSDPPQNKFNAYHPNSCNEPLTPNVLQYAEINDEFLGNDLHLRKKSSISCKQLGSSTSTEQPAVASCPSYAKLDAIFTSTYASLNQTDANLHSPRSNMNTNRKKINVSFYFVKTTSSEWLKTFEETKCWIRKISMQ